MSLTTTYVTGATTLGATQINLSAFTNPSTGAIGAKTIGQFATGEFVLITDASLSPTVQVVRGYNASRAIAHSAYEGFKYGLESDAAWPTAAPLQPQVASVALDNTAVITATGTTGTDAAPVNIPYPGYISLTGASGAGLNLPIGAVGGVYWVKNLGTGTLKVYCVGGSINGTTGTTAVSVTATGNLGQSFYVPTTAGAWQVVPIAT